MYWLVIWLYVTAIFELKGIWEIWNSLSTFNYRDFGKSYCRIYDKYSVRQPERSQSVFFMNWLLFIVVIRVSCAWTNYENSMVRHICTFAHVHEIIWFTTEIRYTSQSYPDKHSRSLFNGIQRFGTVLWTVVLLNAILFLSTDVYVTMH